MPPGTMHEDEVATDVSLVRRLLVAQFPQWADLPIEPVESAGADHAIYRLGGGLAVRLPRILRAVGQAEKAREWLPRLAPHLPLAVPVPLALGAPGEGYPWSWSVCRWLDGADAAHARITDPHAAARDLARFIAALRRIALVGWPPPGPPNSSPGLALADRDASVRDALVRLHGIVDVGAATAAWDAALRLPVWEGAPVWIHGDLQPLNLLVYQDRLSAVIDFGFLGEGDPARDLIPAWYVFAAETRGVFRAALAVDDATWSRGRGWALSKGLISLAYFHRSNPVLASVGRRAIAQVLTDHQRSA